MVSALSFLVMHGFVCQFIIPFRVFFTRGFHDMSFPVIDGLHLRLGLRVGHVDSANESILVLTSVFFVVGSCSVHSE